MKVNKKIIFVIFLILSIIQGALCLKSKYYRPKHRVNDIQEDIQLLTSNNGLHGGDIIFQTSLSRQSIAIQRATKSKYSHCGIIYKEKGRYYVYEAIQPVRRTPLDKWILRGKDAHYVVKRLKNSNELLTVANLSKMKKEGERFKGKNYDLTFEWSDDKIYCSELIWKVYKRAIGV